MEEEQEQEYRAIDPRAIPLLFTISGHNINEKTDDGETMLHVAVRMRDKEIAAVLLEAGANVNITNNEGNTPLSSAIESESPDMVDLMLKYNPDFEMDIVRTKFYTSLMGSSTDDEKIIRSMVKYGFTVKETDQFNTTMLWAAVLLGLENIAMSMVNCEKSFIDTIEVWYQSFLLMTQPYTENQTEILKLIATILDYFQPEHKIVMPCNRNQLLFKILLSQSDIELMNVTVMSLGGNFSDNEEADIVAITKDVLLSCYDGENTILDKCGRTGLHYAAKVGNVGVIQALLELHLDINTEDIDGRTPLSYIRNRITECSQRENSNEIINNAKHYDSEFNCFFTLLDLKIGAVLLVKHVSKLITSNMYITLRNMVTVKALLALMNKDTEMAPYYLSICSYIERCEEEIHAMKNEKVMELTYFDFLKKNYNQIALYTKRDEVNECFQPNNEFLKELEIYGPMLLRRFQISTIRRGLIEIAENIIFDILKWRQLSLVVVREILSNLNNDELTFIILQV